MGQNRENEPYYCAVVHLTASRLAELVCIYIILLQCMDYVCFIIILHFLSYKSKLHMQKLSSNL